MGSRLLSKLNLERNVERIIGFDIKPPESFSPKLKFFQMDVLDPSVISVLEKEKVDILIHLAFVLLPLRDKKRHYNTDINGSRNIIEAAEKNNIKKIILASSTSVYGVHSDNPEMLYEDHTFRPNSDIEYAIHKAEVEGIFSEFRQRNPETIITIFRPCMILGPHMDNPICELACLLPRIITLKGYAPLLQFIHEDDVVNAFIMAIAQDLPGVFNLVGRDTITMAEFCEIFNKDCIRIPFPLLYGIHSFLWAIRFPSIKFSSGWLHFIRYSCIASGEKIRKEFSFYPSFSSREALKSYVESKGVK